MEETKTSKQDSKLPKPKDFIDLTEGRYATAGIDDPQVQEFLRKNIPIKFDWQNKWLKGEEYAHILHHMEEYCRVFSLQKFLPKNHPECIYVEPQSKHTSLFNSLPFSDIIFISTFSF